MRGAALRFLLTRLYDWLNPDPNALVRPKDPREYSKKLRFHNKVKHAREYGLVTQLKFSPTAPVPAIPAPAAGARSCAPAHMKRNCRAAKEPPPTTAWN